MYDYHLKELDRGVTMRTREQIMSDIINHRRLCGLDAMYRSSDHWLEMAAYHEHIIPQYAKDCFRCAELKSEWEEL